MRGETQFCGEYLVVGTGAADFVQLVQAMQPRVQATVAPDVDALRVANEFLGQEVQKT
jgi:hypothetical protein